MKENLITHTLLAVCFISASAQETTKLDPMFNQLRTVIHSGFMTTRGNYGLGRTVTQTQVPIAFNDFCTKEVCGEGESFQTAVSEATAIKGNEESNRRNHEIRDRLLGIIRHGLDSVTALPGVEESYHFESHHQGIDTIRYSICLHSGQGQKKHYNDQQGYFYEDVPGAETVSFNYTTKLKSCGRHFSGWGSLAYSRTENVPGGQSVAFDWEQYMQTLLPMLTQKGITQRTFKWAQDRFYGDADKDYALGFTIYQDDGTRSVAGETTGTIYFIPAERLDFAQQVLKEIDFATQQYIYNHPQQTYQYDYGAHFQPIATEREGRHVQLLRTMNLQEGWHQHYIFVCSDVRGYYFLLCDTRGALWVPRESLMLKSFINGKKTYHKGM